MGVVSLVTFSAFLALTVAIISLNNPSLAPLLAAYLPSLSSTLVSPVPPPTSPYRIIIDAGSTGSRLFIYATSSPIPTRLGTRKSTPGLSTTQHNSTVTFMKLFNYAAEIIPREYHASTKITIGATAGMRLLSEDLQTTIYDSLVADLHSTEAFTFRSLTRADISTLNGDKEGFFGVVSINSLLGNIDSQLGVMEGRNLASALDMGGGSTQITVAPPQGVGARLSPSDVFTHSYLGFGADQFREKVWSHLQSEDARDNPCAFKGWSVDFEGHQLVGSGDAIKCSELIQLIMKESSGEEKRESGMNINNIVHPEVTGEFYAMSLYFFALDCVKTMAEWRQEQKRKSGIDVDAHPSEFRRAWPKPSPDEIMLAATRFCNMDWEVLEPIYKDIHTYTRPDGFPHRCFESVYIGTCLKAGYGFDGGNRGVSYKFDIGGNEVEWTFGMLLVERSRLRA